MENEFLNELKKSIGKDAHIASERTSSGEHSDYYNTGCYLFNALITGSIYQGFPNNKVVELAGEEATGKSYFAINLVKHFLIENPTGIALYFETEGAINAQQLEDRGVDTQRVMLIEPLTVQDFRSYCLRFLERYEAKKKADRPPVLMILDSLGQLSTTKEIEDTLKEKETADMTRARGIKSIFRVLSKRLSENNIALVVTNHVYDVIGAQVPTKKSGGGSGIAYAATYRFFLSRAKDVDTTTKEYLGNKIRINVLKSRFTKQGLNRQVRLSFTTGLDKYYGLVAIAEEAGIWEKIGPRFLIDGVKVYEKTIYKDPEKYFTQDILDKINEYTLANFTYGKNDMPTIEDLHEEEDMEELVETETE